jgi:hypothetical protein
MSRRRVVQGVVALAAGLAAFAGYRPDAQAGKPSGGGGGTAADGGYVWYLESGAMMRMQADGSGKTALSVPGTPFNYTLGGASYSDDFATIDVSRSVHGAANDRWLLYVLPIGDGLTSPAGVPHHEVFAVRERDGARVQMTDGTVLEAGVRRIAVEPDIVRPSGNPTSFTVVADPTFSRSGSGEDGRVTYFARAWTSSGFPTDPGLYGVEVNLSAGTTTLTPTLLTSAGMSFWRYSGPLPWTTWTSATTCEISGTHDWSSDGRTVVWECRSTGGISTTTWDSQGNPATTFLRSVVGMAYPQVNPANGKIVYFGYDATVAKKDVRTMNADGSSETVLVAAPASSGKTTPGLWPPVWSPAGTWVAYGSWSRSLTSGTLKSDVLQIPAGGGSTTNPTSSGSDFAEPIAWRN